MTRDHCIRRFLVAGLTVVLGSCGADSPDSPGALTCTVTPTSGDAPLVVTFSAIAPAAGPSDLRWMFSDGTAAYGASIRRTFSSGGSYSGKVTLLSSGSVRETCTTSAVNVGGSVRLACFADPEEVVVPGDVQFRAEPSGGSGSLSYLWDFGDGGSSTDKDPVHHYQATGVYSAKVTASGGGGVATCIRPVRGLESGVKVACSADPDSGHVPLTVRFSANPSGGNGQYTYLWQFGDGDYSPQRDPSHTYATRGTYTARVTVQSAATAGSCSVVIAAGAPIVCGDGKVEGAEKCDDKNTTAGDGCSATCKIETGYACAGQPSVCAPICGDGLLTGGEACDDGNLAGGDGCSGSCAVEHGFACAGTPSVCSATCGDGLVASTEGCDDGNTAGLDGCSPTCTVEPGFTCTGEPSACI